jgi:hypothetical protein
MLISYKLILISRNRRSDTLFNEIQLAGWLSWYRDWLRAGRSSDRIPVGAEIFCICPDRPRGPPSLLYIGYRVFPGGRKRPGRYSDPSPHSSAEV